MVRFQKQLFGTSVTKCSRHNILRRGSIALLSVVLIGGIACSKKEAPPAAIYFSFVALATLGYGDIVARTDVARGLAIVEGVGGQLFLAVMVARLVSLYSRGEPRTRS